MSIPLFYFFRPPLSVALFYLCLPTHVNSLNFFSAHPCQYPPVPVNGERECFDTDEGVHCSVNCLEGYAFAIQPADGYFCAYDQKWRPEDKLPIPDCSGNICIIIFMVITLMVVILMSFKIKRITMHLDDEFYHISYLLVLKWGKGWGGVNEYFT